MPSDKDLASIRRLAVDLAKEGRAEAAVNMAAIHEMLAEDDGDTSDSTD